jgi:hypothetical protein
VIAFSIWPFDMSYAVRLPREHAQRLQECSLPTLLRQVFAALCSSAPLRCSAGRALNVLLLRKDSSGALIVRIVLMGLACLASTFLATVALPAEGVVEAGSSANGRVGLVAASGNEIVSLITRLVIPEPPDRAASPDGTLFLWPGLQPREEDANYLPIGNGVLQPVVTWGASCAPGAQPKQSWWASGQYVNTVGDFMGYQGCYGGPIIGARSKDMLLMSMSRFGSIWSQTITNLNTDKSTGFHTNLAGQAQGRARFYIEPDSGVKSANVTFLETIIGFARPQPGNCRLDEQGPADVVTRPIILDNGQSCYVASIVLKGPGVPLDVMGARPSVGIRPR